MLHEFAKSFLLIFMAEFGDKTQILLMSLAARYSFLQVASGITVGVALNHGFAILIGSYVSSRVNSMNGDLVQMFIGAIFISFGLLSLAGGSKDDKKSFTFNNSPIMTVALAFFLGELGDKTQLTAMTLAMESESPLSVLLGSVTGMLAVGMVGIIIGISLTKRIPSYIIKIISGTIFILFGIEAFLSVDFITGRTIGQTLLIFITGIVSLHKISKLTVNR
jgi:putative Ca2+/H+ antiporter (TMEM165/GDT1 family)